MKTVAWSIVLGIVAIICGVVLYHVGLFRKPLYRGPHLETVDRIDFGTVEAGKVERTFYIANTGSAPLEIRDIGTECGCAVMKLNRNVLGPGERELVTVTLDGTGYWRQLKKIIYIDSNDPAQRFTMVRLEAYVKVGLRADRSRLYLGAARAGELPVRCVYVIRDTGHQTSDIGVLGDQAGLRVDIGKWETFEEAERLKVEIGVAGTSRSPGAYTHKLQLKAGDQAISELVVTYEVLPRVQYRPITVEVSARNRPATQPSVTLYWSGGPPLFKDATSAYGKCTSKVTAIGQSSCGLHIDAIVEQIHTDGDFDFVTVTYTDQNENRDEQLTIPIRFITERTASNVTP